MAFEWGDLNPLKWVRKGTDQLGLTQPPPPDLSKSPDAQPVRDFAAKIREQYQTRPDAIVRTGANTGITSANEAAARDQQLGAVGLTGAAARAPDPTQQRSLNLLESAARGDQPSAAESLYRKGVDEAAGTSMGMAAAMQGRNPGMALRAGLTSAAGAVTGAAAGGAALRASEMAQARGAFAEGATGARTQDITARQAYVDAITKQRQQDAEKTQNVAQNEIEIGKANQGYGLGLGSLAASSTLAPLNAELANRQLQNQAAAGNAAGAGALAAAGGAALAASDERAKTDVKKKSLADALGEQVEGVTFEYKPGVEDGGKHFGVLAQDLEKVIPGVVRRGAGGIKEVETPQLTLANTGILAEMADRIRKLESRG